MVAPLIRRSRVIGIVTMMHPEPHAFTRRQLEFLQAIAAQAASTVENAALYTRVNNERSTLQALIASVHDVILVMNQDAQLILANPAARQAFALPEDALGRPFEAVIREPGLVEFSRSTPESGQATREIVFEDGRVFDCSLVHVTNVGTLLGMHDVTTFKQLDALKSEFVSHVAHDLKAPLAVMYGYVKILAELPDLNQEDRVYVERIIDSIHRMRGLSDTMTT